MNKNMPEVFVPKQLMEELEGASIGKALETGSRIAAGIIKKSGTKPWPMARTSGDR